MASPYKIHIDLYEGPLDLLLDLISKQEMDIHNIPISKITGQYLDYLHKLEAAQHRRLRRIHLHGRHAHPNQIENAAAARPARAGPKTHG